jgi:hypothetical protein
LEVQTLFGLPYEVRTGRWDDDTVGFVQAPHTRSMPRVGSCMLSVSL